LFQTYSRATGVTAYLKNGGTFERAAQMASRVRFIRHARADFSNIWLYVAPRNSEVVAELL
jgi:hypothetical protein